MATPFDAKQFLATVSTHPGVYQMYDETGELLYIGKARNLRNRLQSYFKQNHTNVKVATMVKRIADIQITLTQSDTEALLLEHNLIKKHRPPFNVLLRDDKSYPYIFISADEYPRIDMYRGSRSKKGQYFGPYPSAVAVKQTLAMLIKIFKLRQCSNSYFSNRTRPCLQYQIGRCSAPCVKKVSQEEYQRTIDEAVRFLQGRSNELIREYQQRMDTAANALDYETAATLRDQIKAIRHIQEEQHVNTGNNSVDVCVIQSEREFAVVEVLMIRDGQLLGNKAYFPKNPMRLAEVELLQEFAEQYYLAQPATLLPNEIVLNHPIAEQDMLASLLQQKLGKKIHLKTNVRSERARWLSLAQENAKASLAQMIGKRATSQKRFSELQRLLSLDALPKRLECFDISHSHGEATVASCVVFGPEGPMKSEYRRFNIEGITAGDDYAAMKQALMRRYSRRLTQGKPLPDILIIDGGKGQIKQALECLDELAITCIQVLGIAKGPSRKAGLEELFFGPQRVTLSETADSPALHLLQHIRDEAHRFAITGHRARRDKKRQVSVLETIEGIGAKRRKQLLAHFGGLSFIKNASIEELAKVPGFNLELAKRVFDALHD